MANFGILQNLSRPRGVVLSLAWCLQVCNPHQASSASSIFLSSSRTFVFILSPIVRNCFNVSSIPSFARKTYQAWGGKQCTRGCFWPGNPQNLRILHDWGSPPPTETVPVTSTSSFLLRGWTSGRSSPAISLTVS